MSVFEQMTTRPNRRCRPETLLRFLISTSYPQSTLSDLTLAIAGHGGKTDPAELELDAEAMREVERSYTMFDFIRCIEVKRLGGTVKVTTKCLDLDPTMRTIVDSADTHSEMAVSTIDLTLADEPIQDPEGLATRLLELFYRSQVKSKRPNDSLERSGWRHRTRRDDRKQKTGSQNVDVDIDVRRAIDIMASSLRKKQFNIVLTQNTILLQDQKARLYCEIKR